MDPDVLIDVCTGCGDEAFVCIVGNGDLTDLFLGPYGLCEDAYHRWETEGDSVTLDHD